MRDELHNTAATELKAALDIQRTRAEKAEHAHDMAAGANTDLTMRLAKGTQRRSICTLKSQLKLQRHARRTGLAIVALSSVRPPSPALGPFPQHTYTITTALR